MLDIRFVRENKDLVQENAQKKGYDVSVEKLLERDAVRRETQQQVDELRERRNILSDTMKAGGKPNEETIAAGREIKDKLAVLEDSLRQLDDEVQVLLSQIPNIIQPDVPIGGEEDSVEIRRWGDNKASAIDHLDFATQRGWVDFERGAKVAGTKFYYLKGDFALLENAIMQFALQFIRKEGFELLSVPALVNSRIATGTGFAPRTTDQSDEYYIEGEDLSLIATAEIPLTGYHADEIIPESELPLFYAAYSPSFRKEAGTYGKHGRGLFRVHQFNKLEMYAYTTPEQSIEVHEKIVAIEEALWQALNIPYRVI
ncbi:MAG TPA: serine--tRNA ligase, partial [Candidatus Saccharibacteria bacterium]|nr:serine--tRNA ligase [Candidatus Saccharibacteria bacterium]